MARLSVSPSGTPRTPANPHPQLLMLAMHAQACRFMIGLSALPQRTSEGEAEHRGFAADRQTGQWRESGLTVLGASVGTGHHIGICEQAWEQSSGPLGRKEALYERCNPWDVQGSSAAQGKAPSSTTAHPMSLGAIVGGSSAAQPRTPGQRAACNELKHAGAQKQRNTSSGRVIGISDEVESTDESHSTAPRQPQPGKVTHPT